MARGRRSCASHTWPAWTAASRVGRPPSARELRLATLFSDIDEARAAVRRAAEMAGPVPVSGFSLADVEQAAAGDVARVRLWSMPCATPASRRLMKRRSTCSRIPRRCSRPPRQRRARRAPDRAHAAPTGRCRSFAAWHRPAGGDAGRARVRPAAAASRRRADDRLRGRQGGGARAMLLSQRPAHPGRLALYGPKLAQVALTFGADDVDNVSPLDEGPRDAGERRSRRSAATSARPGRAGRARRPLRARRLMPVRVGAVSLPQRASARRGLDAAPGRSRSATTCRALRRAAARGRDRPRADPVDRVPAVGDYRVVPGVAVASDGPVASVAIFTRVPIEPRCARSRSTPARARRWR